MNILLCSLGGSWAVIPEAFALLDPLTCPLYRNHPERSGIEELNTSHNLLPPDELWICTTEGREIDFSIDKLIQWRDLVKPQLPLRLWRVKEVSDVASQIAGDQVRELLYRAVLLAGECSGTKGQLILSLAGGRKTMSADLQRAGGLLGCYALLHIIAPPYSAMTEKMQDADPQTFAVPLAGQDCAGILPLVVGLGERSELLDIVSDEHVEISSRNFSLPLAADGIPERWQKPETQGWLPEEITKRQQESGRLLGNYLSMLTREEHHENWRSLYRLGPAHIKLLRSKRLGKKHRDWLIQLPKADLHRHIGGCLNLRGQQRVGQRIWDNTPVKKREKALDAVDYLLSSEKDWVWDWPERVKNHEIHRSLLSAALLVNSSESTLQRNLYTVTEPRDGLQSREPYRFAFYERPGELSGSALLSDPQALELYLTVLLQDAVSEGLRYLELRGSPHKYRHSVQEQLDFLRKVQEIAFRFSELTVRFIIIVDRRTQLNAEAVITLAVEAKRELGEFVVGLDVAGDEQDDDEQTLSYLVSAFTPAFEACLPITIHAGEGTPADKIWEAAYLLHADRVGHGLTLLDNMPLLNRFCDRGITIELCPTSNCEVVGFDRTRPYPLAEYWRQGVPIAICSDNPGISRTSSADEYLKAAELSPDGLSLWDTLTLIKQGFSRSFLSANERSNLIKQIDVELFVQLQADLNDNLL